MYPLQSWRWEQCKLMKQDIFVNPNHMWSFAMPKAMLFAYMYDIGMYETCSVWSKSHGSIFEIFINTSIPISYGLFASINFPVSKRPNQFAQVSPMLPSGQPTVPSHRAVDREALVKGNQFWRNFEAPVCNKLFPFVLLVWRKMYCTKIMLELKTSKCVCERVCVPGRLFQTSGKDFHRNANPQMIEIKNKHASGMDVERHSSKRSIWKVD